MSGFKKFLLRGNVVDLAVAVVIGAAFGSVVTAFVKAFVTPLVGLATGKAGDFTTKTFTVNAGDTEVLFPYGEFVQAALSFVVIAFVVYVFVVRPVQKLMDRFKTEPEAEAPVKECPECLSKIPTPALRCAFCTVEQLDVA